MIATSALASNSIAPTIRENRGKIPIYLQTTSLQKNPTPQELKDYLAQLVSKYGGNYALISDVINCESSWRTNVYSRERISYGVAQFTPPTFKENCVGDYENPYDQLNCMVNMFNKGMEKRWDCFLMLN